MHCYIEGTRAKEERNSVSETKRTGNFETNPDLLCNTKWLCEKSPQDVNRGSAGSMIRKIIHFNAALITGLALCFFIYPAGRAIVELRDPALRQPGVPRVAWRLYENLSPRYAKWAKDRIAAGHAATLSTSDISGTEWPLFGSVFYLWAIENLQQAWTAGDHTAPAEPKVFAREAIIAASELVIDPKHASWVKDHWGTNYLHRENVFYRMLVVAALTSREKLLHDGAHLDMLRDQVRTFARELDSSKTGLLDDYPGECYPGDVMAAWMCLQRADAVLGTDHSEAIQRAIRGFTGPRATPRRLPPYAASSKSGLPSSDSRGCGNSYMCVTAPELWPVQAREWFEIYEKEFWQKRFTGAGFREFAKDVPHADWYMDVDSGPVLAGHGIAASAFGIGACRKNGRFDLAYPLEAEMLAVSWELPNGTLALPRLLSNASDAPLLGEAAILWQLTIQPEKGFTVRSGGSIPIFVLLILVAIFLIGTGAIWKGMRTFRHARSLSERVTWHPKIQGAAWAALMLGAGGAFLSGHTIIGIPCLLIAVMLPVRKRTAAREISDENNNHSPHGAIT